MIPDGSVSPATARCCFEDGIDLVLVAVALVVKPDRLLGEGELACQCGSRCLPRD